MKKNIIIIILSILVIGLSGYLVYDKVLVKDNVDDFEQNENDQENEIRAVYNDDSKWFNYLKDVNITSVKLSFWKFDSESETGIGSNDVELSKDEIDSLFTSMRYGILTNDPIGYAVGSSVDYLRIEYDTEKWVNFYDLKHIETNDDVLKKYFVQDVGTSDYLYRCYWSSEYYYEKYNK